MSSRVLLLSPWFSPLKVISWQMAIRLVYLGKVNVIETYDEDISSPSATWKMPAVIQLRSPMENKKRGIKFSRINVYTRDNFTCQYCNTRKEIKDLNYDHVTPRVKGGLTNWTNIVTSCYPCNDKKGSKTVEQAGMRLLKKPTKPKSLPMSYLQLDRQTIPEAWKAYCPQDVEKDKSGLYLMTGTK